MEHLSVNTEALSPPAGQTTANEPWVMRNIRQTDVYLFLYLLEGYTSLRNYLNDEINIYIFSIFIDF